MPKVERLQVSSYMYEHQARAIGALAERWGRTVSQTAEILIRWGAYALQIEEAKQGQDMGIQDLADALAAGTSAGYGPIEPSRTVARAIREALDGRLAELKAQIGDTDGEPDRGADLREAVREVIRELKAAGEL